MMKRGVSLYSYQQEQFFKRMDFRDMVKEVHNLGCDGIEIIDESLIRQYPNPSEEFVSRFKDTLAEFGMRAVTMDVNMDPLLYRDHVMTHKECADRLIQDIKLGARLGFQNLRLCGVPIDAMELALPAAEDYNVRIGKEIHVPFTIRPNPEQADKHSFMPSQPYLCQEVIELAERKSTRHVGVIPDMGIFQHRISGSRFAYLVRHGANPGALRAADRLYARGLRQDALVSALRERGYPEQDAVTSAQATAFRSDVDPRDLLEIVPYILSIHGKFYEMTEIPGAEGQYEELSIDYDAPFYYLHKGGYEGYINSEYEGQRDAQDRDLEHLADEVEQVRWHHEMVGRLINTYWHA